MESWSRGTPDCYGLEKMYLYTCVVQLDTNQRSARELVPGLWLKAWVIGVTV